jgi:hypothetical protein
MNKAFLTIVVTGTTAAEVVEQLRDANLGVVQVLAEGDISVAEKDVDLLPNEFWLHVPDVADCKRLRLVANDTTSGGRWLTEEELAVLKQYGVCVEAHVSYAADVPSYVVHKEAFQATVSGCGFDVAPTDRFQVYTETTDPALIEDGTERRWLRIKMPAWFNLNP